MGRVSLEDTPILCVISGGQTGADRGGLDGAMSAGVPVGGWCPADRRAEDGVIPPQYPLRCSTSPDYAVRTALNVELADGTAVLVPHSLGLTAGTRLTIDCCEGASKLYLVGYFHLHQDAPNPSEVHLARDLRAWAVRHGIRVLNVAGPRESKAPGMQAAAMRIVYWALVGA